ncbi:hypothetical protein PG993_010505 [Apiospora rasikravindrae]|uniref:RING-type domain-containing protein n=1 Tax=Apiospora rasikravindrae TaxID=990691 RepID=A0ABR1SP86_9PEZI
MRTPAPNREEEKRRASCVQVAAAGYRPARGGYREQRAQERRQGIIPICLASLYGLSPSERPSSEPEVEAGGGGGAVRGDLEAGTLKQKKTPAGKEASASVDVAEMAEAAKKRMMDKLQTPRRTSWRPQPIDDEILKMRRCPHMFHARCLATWFLMKRYDCPVCRAAYYQTSNESEESLSGRESVRPASLGIPVLPFCLFNEIAMIDRV